MCCSRKYPYPCHRGFFGSSPQPYPAPLEIPVLVHFSFKHFGFWNTPSLLEFPITLLGVGMDIFWSHTMIVLIRSEHSWFRNLMSNFYLLYSQTNSKTSLFQESNERFQVEGMHCTYHIWNMLDETAFFLQPASPLDTLYCDKQNNHFPRMVIFLPSSEKVLQKFCSKRNKKRP